MPHDKAADAKFVNQLLQAVFDKNLLAYAAVSKTKLEDSKLIFVRGERWK
jgi:hypothetical protein